MKMLMKHIIGKMVQRIRRADFPTWTIDELVPIMFAHIEAYLAAKGQAERSNEDEDVYDLALGMFANKHHVALRSTEVYFRSVSSKMMELLLPPETKNCLTLKTYFAEALTAYAFKPSVASFSSPYYINKKCAEILDQNAQPFEIPPLDAPSHETYLLESILPSVNPASAFTRDLDSILSDRTLLKPFQKFLENNGYIEALILYRNLEIVLQSTKDNGVNQNNLEMVVDMAKDIHASFQTGPEFMQVYVKPGFMEAVKATKNSIEPSTCQIATFIEIFEVVKNDLGGRLRILFLKSDAYFVTLCGARDASLRRVSGMTNMAKDPRKKAKAKSSEPQGLTQADIERLNLPAPPSAFEELHTELVVEKEQKKKGFFARKKEKKKVDLDKLHFSDRSTRRSMSSAPSSPAMSPLASPVSSPLAMRRNNPNTAPDAVGSDSALSRSLSGHKEPPTPVLEANEDGDMLGDLFEAAKRVALDGQSIADPVKGSIADPVKGIDANEVDDGDLSEAEQFEAIDDSDFLNSFSLTTLENVIVEVTRWERRHPGVRQYVVYHISILANGKATEDELAGDVPLRIRPQWNVYRRYSEFTALEKRLKALYPEYLTELPDKKRFGNLEKLHVDNRRKLLNSYIQVASGFHKSPFVLPCHQSPCIAEYPLCSTVVPGVVLPCRRS